MKVTIRMSSEHMGNFVQVANGQKLKKYLSQCLEVKPSIRSYQLWEQITALRRWTTIEQSVVQSTEKLFTTEATEFWFFVEKLHKQFILWIRLEVSETYYKLITNIWIQLITNIYNLLQTYYNLLHLLQLITNIWFWAWACICANEKLATGPSCSTLRLFTYPLRPLNQIWRYGSLQQGNLAIPISPQNTPFLPGYKCCWFCRSRKKTKRWYSKIKEIAARIRADVDHAFLRATFWR